MPHKLKLGFISGLSIAVLFALSSFIITEHASVSSVIIKALTAGMIGGSITPFSFQNVLKFNKNFFSRNHFKCDTDESIIHQSEAVYNKQNVKFEGQLFFTEKRLVFLPNNTKKNTQLDIIIPLNTIQKTSSFNPMGPMTQGLEITCKDGTNYRFTVDNTDLWLSVIGKTIQN